MDWTYTYNVDQTLNDKVDVDRLVQEIRDSIITVALDRIDVTGNIIGVVFKAELSDPEETTLNGIIAAHTGEPLPPITQIVKSEQLTEHIKWVEKGDTTQGFFAAQSLVVDVSANQAEKITDFTWPYDIAIMSGTLGISEEMVGDDVHIYIGPNALIGVNTQPINVGDTSIYVSPTVIENIGIGYYFGLYNAGDDTGHELGQVWAIDAENSCIQIGTPADVSANAMSPVSMCVKLIPMAYLHSQDQIEIGKDLPTGQRIPKGTKVRVIYHNNNLVAKKISFFVEYLY